MVYAHFSGLAAASHVPYFFGREVVRGDRFERHSASLGFFVLTDICTLSSFKRARLCYRVLLVHHDLALALPTMRPGHEAVVKSNTTEKGRQRRERRDEWWSAPSRQGFSLHPLVRPVRSQDASRRSPSIPHPQTPRTFALALHRPEFVSSLRSFS